MQLQPTIHQGMQMQVQSTIQQGMRKCTNKIQGYTSEHNATPAYDSTGYAEMH